MARTANGAATNVRQLQLVIMSMQDELRRAAAPELDVDAIQALIDASMSAAPAAVVEIPAASSSLTFEQGTYDFDGVTTFYVSYGVDGNWEAIEHTTTTNKTTGTNQTGTRPTTTAEFVTKSYPDEVS